MDKSSVFSSRMVTILFTLFIIALGYGVILPILPFYTERLALGSGASFEEITYHIGFLTSVYPFFQMFFAPLWGRWSDRIGRRPLIIIGVLGFIVMQVLIGLSTSIWMLYLARIVGGIFTSAVIPVSYALVSDLTTKDNRANGIAFAGTAYSLGIVAGPFIGGVLSQSNFHLNFKFGHFLINDYSVPFFFLAFIGVILMGFVWKGLKESGGNQKSKIEQNSDPMNWLEMVQNLLPLLMLSFFYQVTLTLFEAVFSIYSKNELQFDAISIGYGFMICALVMALLQPIAVSKRMKDKISWTNQIILGFLIFGSGILMLLLANQLTLVLITIGFLATGGAFIIPNITSRISINGDKSSGSALGIQKSTDSLGQVIGPILGSWLFTINGSFPYLLTGMTVIFVSFLLFVNRRNIMKYI